MRDLIILTSKPLDYSLVAQVIKDGFSNLKIRNDTERLLYVKYKNVGFELEFFPNDRLSDPDSMMGDTVAKCPNKDAYLTGFSYTSVYVAKKMISLLKPLFEEMWIQSDEADNWFGTAEEFIEHYE